MEEPRDQQQAPPSEQNPNSIPDSNPNPNPNRPRTVKGKSCKGCAYYSSVLKSKSKNPTCYGLSRTLQEGISLSLFLFCFFFLEVDFHVKLFMREIA